METAQPKAKRVADRPRVLVLGTEHPRAAAVVRSLAKAGIRVDVADHYDPPTAFWRSSRYIRKRLMLDEDPGRAMRALRRIGEQGGGLLVPTNDHYLIAVSQEHRSLSEAFTVTTPPWSVLEPLMDKVQASRLARDAGIEAPRYYKPTNRTELEDALATLDFQERAYVLKIRMWDSGAADPQTLRRVRPAGADAVTVRSRCEGILHQNGEYPLIEEVVSGGADRCLGVSMVVDHDHRPVLTFCVRRLKLQLYAKGRFKHPYELGANAYCESAYDAEAIELAKRFVQRTRYTGAITVEFKRDSLDDHLMFIKADCRVVRATSLSTALGLDMPTALYEVYSGGGVKQRYPQDYRTGVNWLWLEAYAYSLWKNRREIGLVRELWCLAKRLPRVRAWAYFSWRDPFPSVLLALTAPRRLKLLQNPGARTARCIVTSDSLRQACSVLRTCLTTQQSPGIQVRSCFPRLLETINNTSLKKHHVSLQIESFSTRLA